MSHQISTAGSTSYALHQDDREEILHCIEHYEDPRAASIDALKIVQKRHGWVPDEAIPAVGKILGITNADVEGVATFYNMIFRKPVGRHVIKVCDSIGCFLTGYEDIITAIKQQLGIEYGQTTPDGRFTLLPVCCLGNCDKGPTLMIDDDTHGPLTVNEIPALLERYI
jgi:NADH-quinone oxidoreductase subunit E